LLAADVVAAAEDKKYKQLGERVAELTKKRLSGTAELHIVAGKLLLSSGPEAAKEFEAAIKQLEAEKATPRRQAQAQLGSAIVAYVAENDAAAVIALDLALQQDPSLYEGYQYYADIETKRRNLRAALAKAQLAIQYNPDNLGAYAMVGTLAHKLKDRRLLDEMTRMVGAMAPTSAVLKQLQDLNK
jgi:tetratricopeptide (TPR) repeat protein